MRELKVFASGTLSGATQRNRLDFCNPSTGQVIATCYTNSPPAWGPVALAAGQYKLRVNERCWATSPNPLNVYLGMGAVTVTATCVNQGSYKAASARGARDEIWMTEIKVAKAKSSQRLDFYKGNMLMATVFTADDGSAYVSVPMGVNKVAVNGGPAESLTKEVKSEVLLVEIQSPQVNTGVGAPPAKKRNPVKKK